MNKNNLRVNNLKKQVISGMIILLLREGILKMVAIVGQFILVKLLLPEQFGVFAFIVFLVSIAEFFGDLGLGYVIIQNPRGTNNTILSTIFIIKQILGIVALLLLVTITLISLHYYSFLSKEYAFMVILLGLTLLVKPYKSILVSIMDKDLNYKAISVIDTAGIMAYYVVAIVVALAHQYVINFVAGLIVKEIVELVCAIYYVRWVPQAKFDLSKIRGMLKFGFYLQMGSVYLMLHNAIIPLLGGKLYGSAGVGYLNWGLGISQLPASIIDNYGRVALSGISKIQNRYDLVSASINKSTSYLNSVLYLFVGLALLYSNDVVRLIIGDKWLPGVPSMLLFISILLFTGSMVSIGHAIIAVGKSKELSFITFAAVIFELSFSLIFGKLFGLTTIAAAFLISYFLQFLLYIYLARKFSFVIELYRSFFLKVAILCLAMLIFSIVNIFFPTTIVSLIVKMLLFVLAYVFLLYYFVHDETLEIFNTLINLKRK